LHALTNTEHLARRQKAHVKGFHPLVCAANLKLYLDPIPDLRKLSSSDVGAMKKDLLTISHCDKAIAFVSIEPFYFTDQFELNACLLQWKVIDLNYRRTAPTRSGFLLVLGTLRTLPMLWTLSALRTLPALHTLCAFYGLDVLHGLCATHMLYALRACR
jgi:hypothetical protein